MKATWDAVHGLRYLLLEPEGEAVAAPLVVAIHGRGADPTDLAGLALEMGSDGYRWLLPQGPLAVPLGGGSVGWAWYELGDRQAEAVVEARDLLSELLDYALPTLAVPRSRTLICGFSQGAVMALHVGLASEQPFAGIAAMSGHLPAADALVPLLKARRERRVCLVHGALDPIIPIDAARKACDVLRQAGLAPEYHEFPMAHQITTDSLAVVREYVFRVLPPVAL